MVPRLSTREIHVWRVNLDAPPPEVERLAELLATDERRRSERFLREADRRRFIVSHAALRTILGQYLGIPPEQVETVTQPGGKPELAPSAGAPSLRYNLSHSDEVAMVAAAMDQEVGVDVERVRSLVDVENIVERYFAPGERAIWRTLPAGERLAAFFRCWTRKEAYLKGRGIGLSSGLDRFEVSLAPGEPARLVRSDEPADVETRWHLHDVSAGEGYMAVCAVEGEINRISVFDWPPHDVTRLEPIRASEHRNPRPS